MNNESPLVSVGIPAYNKPEGLRRTLKCITGQTHKNLEIIISDDCSPDKETETVAREFIGKDPRIQYIRQQKNIGAESNFKFLLEKAAGEYFMWAGDDDEWDGRFIEVCISKIGNCSSAMPGYKFFNRARNKEFSMNIPDLSPQYGAYRNLRNYLMFHPSAFMYGLHKRADILWFLKWELFDGWDHHFASKLLVDCNGIMLIRDYCGFTVGIDTEEYILKPVRPRPGRLFEHYPLMRHDVSLIAASKKLSIVEKIKLVNMVFLVFLEGFANCEKNTRPVRAKLCRFILISIRWYQKGLKSLSSMYRRVFPRKHVIITGTGRTGTTFLVQLLTYLGLETGFTRQNMVVSQYARAGLENDVRKDDAPYIVKSPWFCDYAKEVVNRKDIKIKHVFIPIRDLHAAVESRRHTEKITPPELKRFHKKLLWTDGGLLHADGENDQGKILLQKFYMLVLALSDTATPITLLLYPRLTKDKLYLYKKLKPILKRTSYGKFCSAFDKVVRPDLVHDFGEDLTQF